MTLDPMPMLWNHAIPATTMLLQERKSRFGRGLRFDRLLDVGSRPCRCHRLLSSHQLGGRGRSR